MPDRAASPADSATRTRPPLVDIRTIVAGLAARAPELVAELLPRGRRAGPEWEVGSLAGEPGRSLKIHLSGPRAGVWRDFAGDAGGDALALVAAVLYGGDVRRALAWARAWLGYDTLDPAKLAAQRARLAARAVAAQQAARHDDDDKRERCRRLWLAARRDLLGTPVETYLAGRGIPLREIDRIPAALRYAPALRHPETGRDHPALVACISGRAGPGGLVAVHRTWLQAHPDGRVTKASVRDPKMTLGRYAGGSIRLSRGSTGRPLAEAEPGETVALTEGIEDGLTVAYARPDLRVLVAVSLGNMLALDLPPQITTVLIAGQNDPPGSKAADTLGRVVERFRTQGRTVRVARPPAGTKDYNDLIRTGGEGDTQGGA